MYSTDFAAAAADPRLLARVSAQAGRVGAEMNKATALCYDALELLFAAARRSDGVDATALRAGLAGQTDFVGLTGPIAYAGKGDPERMMFLVGLEGGRLALRARLPREPGR